MGMRTGSSGSSADMPGCWASAECGRQKTRPLRGGFLTHTLAKNTLNNQKSEFREARGRDKLGADGHRCLEGWQLDRDLHRVPGEVAQRVQAAIDV